MDDPFCLRALDPIGVDMAHHIMAGFFFPGDGNFIVDVVLVGFQLGDLLLSDGQALGLLRLGEGNPQPAPGLEFIVL